KGFQFEDEIGKNAEDGDRLVLLIFNLQEYRQKELTEEAVAFIENAIDSAAEFGMQAIIRFTYDWDGRALETEPEDRDRIFQHMKSLEPLFERKKRDLYLIQGVFIGNHGEMHGSNYANDKDIKALAEQLLKTTPKEVFLSVRTPEFWRVVTDRTEPPGSFEEGDASRFGLFNDGLLSSDTDLGTYSDGTGYKNRWEREEELAFQEALCRFVPNGGEFALDSEYNDLENVLEEFPRLHISYLNRGYNREVLEKLENTTYQGEGGDPYDGLNGLKYVGDHLGYRYVLRKVEVPQKIYPGKDFFIELEIENSGFAPFYRKADIQLILQSEDGTQTLIDAREDIRTWKSKQKSIFRISIPQNTLQKGLYQMFLKVEDQKDRGVSFANPTMYQEDIGANAIGEMEIISYDVLSIWKPTR
ncbi:MAG TPA: hypothetical protein DHN33_11085, partial [Eubacteriaceae bacterium]|nr:hypothetical protein [Eubacteriaceae bacterium]